MAKKLGVGGKLDFSNIDLTAPDIVVGEIAAQISDETNGIVHGVVEPYDGRVYSYTSRSGVLSVAEALGQSEKKVDIQTTLGKRGEEVNKFEFFLNTPSYEQYKYRVCYLKYGLGNYPVDVILEQSIAKDINTDSSSSYIYKCNTREELEDLIVRIVCSDRVIGVMQELIRINQIQKELDDECSEEA